MYITVLYNYHNIFLSAIFKIHFKLHYNSKIEFKNVRMYNMYILILSFHLGHIKFFTIPFKKITYFKYFKYFILKILFAHKNKAVLPLNSMKY